MDKVDMQSGVYEILNTLNGHRYIGSSKNIVSRWRDHKKTLRANNHRSRYLQRAWNKYGEGLFKFSVLVCCEKEHNLLYEQMFIDKLNPSYNLEKIAGSSLGTKRSESAIENMRKAKADIGEETREKMSRWQMGRKLPKETREKQSLVRRGRKLSAEHKQKIAKAHLSKPRTRLKPEEVLEIVRLYNTGEFPQIVLAKMFMVGKSSISSIVYGCNWSKVTGIKKDWIH